MSSKIFRKTWKVFLGSAAAHACFDPVTLPSKGRDGTLLAVSFAEGFSLVAVWLPMVARGFLQVHATFLPDDFGARH